MVKERWRNVLADLELIARDEELDMPWRRIRHLLDYELAVIEHSDGMASSRTSLALTEDGLRFIDQMGAWIAIDGM